MVTEFSKINCKRETLHTLLKRFGEHEAPAKHIHIGLYLDAVADGVACVSVDTYRERWLVLRQGRWDVVSDRCSTPTDARRRLSITYSNTHRSRSRGGGTKKIVMGGWRCLRMKPTSGYCWGANPRKSSDRFLNNSKAEFSQLHCVSEKTPPFLFLWHFCQISSDFANFW